MPDPAAYSPGVAPSEVTLTIGWGAISHVDLEPATCGDENCEADHGYTGSITADDLQLRVSEAADGPEGRAPRPGLRGRPVGGDGPHVTGTLADIAGSVYATFDGTGGGTLGLRPADKVCLFIVDGLGADLLAAHPSRAPFLSSALARVLTAGFPSSTPISLATISTGVQSGYHGMLGIQVAVPGENRLLNCLRWTVPGAPVDPATWQPLQTVFQRLAHLDVACSYVAPGAYDGAGRPGRSTGACATSRPTPSTNASRASTRPCAPPRKPM